MYEGVFYSLLIVMFLEKLKERVLYSRNMFLVTLMGVFTTLPHELAHYLVALALGGKPEGIYLIPRKIEANGTVYYTFGSVKCHTNGFTVFFIGLAPLLWLVAAYYAARYWEIENLKDEVLFFLTEWIFITNAIPSKTDLKVAFSSVWGWIMAITAIGVLIWLKSGKNCI